MQRNKKNILRKKQMQNIEKKYILNPYYSLKNDKKRVVLCNAPSFKIPEEIAEESISSYIHPAYAMALSFFNGENTLEFCIDKISKLFGATTEDSYNFVSPYLDNKKRVVVKYDGKDFEFPRRILLDNSQFNFYKRELNWEDYNIEEELDFKTFRLIESPTTINLLVNTICVTDCIYCYVQRDKRIDCQIPVERLREIIKEAKQQKISKFDIGGTEVFLYKHWDILMKTLLENGFYPYLSTKVPLTLNDLQKIKNMGVDDLQLSIDTADNSEAQKVNGVKIGNYSDKIFETLKNTEKAGLNIVINSVLTKYNSGKESIKKLLDKINLNSNIESVTLNPGETSLYCSENNFNDFKLSIKEIEEIESFINQIKSNYKFKVNVADYDKINNYQKDLNKKTEEFSSRAYCSGNISQFCILPDGQVTICEELYWDPRFIIGNILNNSISEVWQSEKALKLYNISQEEISEHSSCKTCKEFLDCRRHKGVCWSDILTAYGKENWDFPPSDCPYAPFPYYNIYHE